VIRVSLQCHILHDLIIVLDTLWGDMHGGFVLGKSENLLFLAVLESGLIADLISYLRTQLEDLPMCEFH
jgi:hypothetical protein